MATRTLRGASLGVDAVDLEEQVEDLKDRMRMLQHDRKANIELLQSTKEANKDIIQELRSENKELRQGLSAIQRENNAHGAGNTETEDLAKLRRSVAQQRKTYDDLKHKADIQKKALDELKDEVRDLERQNKKPSDEDTPEIRKIRLLENKLDKAMIKFNEAIGIRKTYEQILKRLKAERIGYDNQLAAIERALKAKQADYEELLVLATEASYASETAQLELEKVKGGYDEERRRRQRLLKEKTQLLEIKKEMQQRMEQREKARQDIIFKEAGELSEEQEVALNASLTMNKLQAGKTMHDKVLNKNKLELFETAFRKIKEATGVSDVNEILKKIVSQESTTENLMALSRENQVKIELLTSERNRLKSQVDEAKFSGTAGAHRRKVVDEQEEYLNNAQARLDRVKVKYERLAKILIGVKAGIEHLYETAMAFSESGNRPNRVEVTDDNVVELMYSFEQTISNVCNELKANEGILATGNATNFVEEPSPPKPSRSSFHKEGQGISLLPNNQRIVIPNEADDDSDGASAKDDMELGADEDDTLSRDKVKRASVQILEAQKKKKRLASKRRSGKDGDGDKVSEEEGLNAPS